MTDTPFENPPTCSVKLWRNSKHRRQWSVTTTPATEVDELEHAIRLALAADEAILDGRADLRLERDEMSADIEASMREQAIADAAFDAAYAELRDQEIADVIVTIDEDAALNS